MVREKIVAAASRHLVILIGPEGAAEKLVPVLGTRGRLPVEVQQTIEARLAEKAIEPQVIVTVTKSISNSVTVTGEVVNGARVPLSLKGDRLLDLILPKSEAFPWQPIDIAAVSIEHRYWNDDQIHRHFEGRS